MLLQYSAHINPTAPSRSCAALVVIDRITWSACAGQRGRLLRNAQMQRFPFGDGKYIAAWWNPTLYVDYKLIESRGLNKVELENAAQEFLRDYPGVEAVYTRTQMVNGMMPNTKLAKQVILAWHQMISGDIVIMNKPKVSVRETEF
jgi:hypothetical protein